ncbi:hypothetical protein ABXT64_10920 [Candidatus Marifrigoribacter sp. Uisw_064]|uniref:hypothetical protein n=1 Tax=Candidatus Marifrigoribacter sp. Uisw_064 TaxID=3230970 RepID=UPI003D441DF1
MDKSIAEFICDPDLSRKVKVLLILFDNISLPKTVKEIKTLGKTNGIRDIEKWNVSMVLSALKGKVSKLKDGWIINSKGEAYLKENNYTVKSPLIKPQIELAKELDNVKTNYVRDFISEAIKCLEYNLLKSSVVFSWIGAISLLYEYIINHKLTEFNTEAKRRNAKWKNATNIDGLTRMKEYDFLQILEGISVMGKNTKGELENCLKLRNSCGHPSTLKIGPKKVEAHIEILLLNVYQKYN